MIRVTITVLLLGAIGLSGCAYLGLDETGKAGNPSRTPYSGEPGSIYDSSAGPNFPAPPQATYNLEPLAPMTQQTPRGQSAPLQPATPTPR